MQCGATVVALFHTALELGRRGDRSALRPRRMKLRGMNVFVRMNSVVDCHVTAPVLASYSGSHRFRLRHPRRNTARRSDMRLT